jgi:ribosome biogenesis protein Tsr3
MRFLEVNQDPLDLYSRARDSADIIKIQELFI